jgi:hypothetical protein
MNNRFSMLDTGYSMPAFVGTRAKEHKGIRG